MSKRLFRSIIQTLFDRNNECAGLSPLGRRPLVALVYPTPEQAAATLIAVHCCTWSVKTQTSSNVPLHVM